MTIGTRLLLILLLAIGGLALACSDDDSSRDESADAAAESSQLTPPPEPGPDAERFESGLIITHIVVGQGPAPDSSSRVRVHYHGRLMDGEVFDSSVERNEPAVFPLNRVIPCWTEALQKMKVGGKAEIICPPQIAYGARGAPPVIPPNATLHFEVELLDIL